MTLSARRAGDAIARAAVQLLQVWRASRAEARPDVFPGLLDGLLEDFFARAGEALAEGRDPALVWPAAAGLVRLDAHDLARSHAELDAEWDLAEEVLRSACEALDAGDGAAEWLARAIVIARSGARTLDRGGGPPGVALAWSLSGLAGARQPSRADGRR